MDHIVMVNRSIRIDAIVRLKIGGTHVHHSPDLVLRLITWAYKALMFSAGSGTQGSCTISNIYNAALRTRDAVGGDTW